MTTCVVDSRSQIILYILGLNQIFLNIVFFLRKEDSSIDMNRSWHAILFWKRIVVTQPQ